MYIVYLSLFIRKISMLLYGYLLIFYPIQILCLYSIFTLLENIHKHLLFSREYRILMVELKVYVYESHIMEINYKHDYVY